MAHQHGEHPLVGITRLVGMPRGFQETSLFNGEDNLFERDPAVRLKPIILSGVPGESLSHSGILAQCVPCVNRPNPPLARAVLFRLLGGHSPQSRCAFLKTSRNIPIVRSPVCVFWRLGWYMSTRAGLPGKRCTAPCLKG